MWINHKFLISPKIEKPARSIIRACGKRIAVWEELERGRKGKKDNFRLDSSVSLNIPFCTDQVETTSSREEYTPLHYWDTGKNSEVIKSMWRNTILTPTVSIYHKGFAMAQISSTLPSYKTYQRKYARILHRTVRAYETRREKYKTVTWNPTSSVKRIHTQMALMSDSWPVKVCRHIPSLTSHSLAEASQAPETKHRASGARDKLITSPVCPVNVVVCWPVSMSQRALERIIKKAKFNTFVLY